MKRFEKDVERYLESMPTIDANVILGYLPTALAPASAHELVSDAIKLDVSARNVMPTTCCIWLGQRMLHIDDILSAIVASDEFARGGHIMLGVGENSFHSRYSSNKWLANLRTHVELDLISKYPEMCEIRSSDKHYGPAGNDVIEKANDNDDHWKELTERRLSRVDKLTISWRDAMLNEWSSSLYESRQQRFVKRVGVVKKCVGVYHKQYKALRDNIVSERLGLISRYSSIESELLSLIQEDFVFFEFHTSFLERSLRRYEAQFERVLAVQTKMMTQYLQHCGGIRRRGLARVAAAANKLKENLEISCNRCDKNKYIIIYVYLFEKHDYGIHRRLSSRIF